MPYAQVLPVLDPKVRGMCRLPYEGHPKGCPNYGQSHRCPPEVAHLDEVYDLGGPFYAVWSVFPLGEHVSSMRVRHPGWSERQLRCVLYWQGSARKRLREEVARFRAEHPEHDWLVETTPEAMGVHVGKTVAEVGLVLPWPPTELAYHVALAGRKRVLFMEFKERQEGRCLRSDSSDKPTSEEFGGL